MEVDTLLATRFIRYEYIKHKDMLRYKLMFGFFDDLKQLVMQLEGARYSRTLRSFHIPATDSLLDELAMRLPADVRIEPTEQEEERQKVKAFLHEEVPLVQYRKYLEQMRYSKKTTDLYVGSVAHFFAFLRKRPTEITFDDILDYNHFAILEAGKSASTQNIRISALKLFYERFAVYNFDLRLLERPRRGSYLPVVLSKSEMKKILEGTYNIKHRAILMMIYSAGLRVGEVLGLKLTDIDSSRMVIHIRQSKGAKDRMVGLSEKVLVFLRVYVKSYRPKEYLFEGMNGGKYTASSINKLIHARARAAGVRKKITAHTLRHSFATHMLEDGIDLRHIQMILGHASSRTTEIYTHVSNRKLVQIKSPIDSIL